MKPETLSFILLSTYAVLSIIATFCIIYGVVYD